MKYLEDIKEHHKVIYVSTFKLKVCIIKLIDSSHNTSHLIKRGD